MPWFGLLLKRVVAAHHYYIFLAVAEQCLHGAKGISVLETRTWGCSMNWGTQHNRPNLPKGHHIPYGIVLSNKSPHLNRSDPAANPINHWTNTHRLMGDSSSLKRTLDEQCFKKDLVQGISLVIPSRRLD